MYRVFCESYQNYVHQHDKEINKNEYRFEIAEPFELIANVEKYQAEKEHRSGIYKQLSDLLDYVGKNLETYPRLKAFLWTLESRGIKGEYFGVARTEDMREQAKLLGMFLRLLYWEQVGIS